MNERYMHVGVVSAAGNYAGYTVKGSLNAEEVRYLHLTEAVTEGFFFGTFSNEYCCRYTRRVTDNGRPYMIAVGMSFDRDTGRKLYESPDRIPGVYHWLNGLTDESLSGLYSTDKNLQSKRWGRFKGDCIDPPLDEAQKLAVTAVVLQNILHPGTWYLLDHGSVSTIGMILEELPQKLCYGLSFACPYSSDSPVALFNLLPREASLQSVRVQSTISECGFATAEERLERDAVAAARFLRSLTAEERKSFCARFGSPKQLAEALVRCSRLCDAAKKQDLKLCKALMAELSGCVRVLPERIMDPVNRLLETESYRPEQRRRRRHPNTGWLPNPDDMPLKQWIPLIAALLAAAFLFIQLLGFLPQIVSKVPSVLGMNLLNTADLILLVLAIRAWIYRDD